MMRKTEANSLMAHILAVHGARYARLKRLAGPDEWVVILDSDDYYLWEPHDYSVWLHTRNDAVEERRRKSAHLLQQLAG